MMKATPVAVRFWPKVNESGPTIRPELGPCWVWTASLNTGGYGQIGVEGRRKDYAHRVSYELHFGSIPEGQMVLHRCDNRQCVRPEHLFLGTALDNTTDMLNKQRGKHSAKTCCPYGHPYDATRPDGSRRCRACTRKRSAEFKARERAKRDA